MMSSYLNFYYLQIEGAFIQGYGLYCMEEPLHSPSGNLITRGPGNYKIPAFTDCPRQFNVHLLKNSRNPHAIFKSKVSKLKASISFFNYGVLYISVFLN